VRKRAGGYVIEIYKTDHPPLHAHIFKDGDLVGRFDLENKVFMAGTYKRHRGRMLRALHTAGLI
jgi:hypothetical protein